MRGAGGTNGGLGQFFIGLAMFVLGGYLLLNAIQVHNGFGLGYSLFSVGGVGITSGLVLIPFVFGVGMLFFDARQFIGWALTIGSLGLLIFGVISSVNFQLRAMSAFDLLLILTLLAGGAGLFLSSLRSKA